MIVCIPVAQDGGLQSPLSGHFGSTPLFMIVDTADGRCHAVANRNQHHEHGTCQPLQSLEGIPLEAVIVSGIGPGALRKLEAAGLPVYHTDSGSVSGALAGLAAGTLPRVTVAGACSHHEHDHGHDHGAPAPETLPFPGKPAR